MARSKSSSIIDLCQAGFAVEDAVALRRISMTLHRWHELECGDGNQWGSWCITRGRKNGKAFEHDDDGKPFLEHHHFAHGNGADTVSYSPLADKERAALKRLGKIMAGYPGFKHYVQGDPRGCALYILRPTDLNGLPFGTTDFSSIYNRGIAVYK